MWVRAGKTEQLFSRPAPLLSWESMKGNVKGWGEKFTCSRKGISALYGIRLLPAAVS